MSVIQAVLLGILGGLGIWDSRVMGLCMMERPLFLGPVVGLILGDFQTGIVVGASLELVMMGIVGIGSATIPDTVSASILATAFAITSGLDVSAAVGLQLLDSLWAFWCVRQTVILPIRRIRRLREVIIKVWIVPCGAAPACSLLLISSLYFSAHCLGLQ